MRIVDMILLPRSDSPLLESHRLPPHLLLHGHLLDQLVLDGGKKLVSTQRDVLFQNNLKDP